jgi:DNA-binding response OmpR family regulator
VIEPDDKVPPWRIDVYGTKIQVTPTESEILGLLVKKADQPVSWESLAHACYGGGVRPAGARKDYVGDERKNLKTYIHILRKKLRAARAPAEIVSAWGFGVELKKSELKKAA